MVKLSKVWDYEKSEMIGVKITPSLKAKLAEIAEIEDRSISYIVNKLIEDYIKKEN